MTDNGTEVVAATIAPAVEVATSTASHASCTASPSYACDCCVVWEIIRGPHAGERAVFSARDSTETTTLLRIGRQSQCWLRLKKDLEVSGIHAELSVVHTPSLTLRLCDAKSTNGTKINGQTAEKRVEYEVNHQDLLQFGRSTVRVSRGDTRCPCAWNGGDAEELKQEEVKAEKEVMAEKKVTEAKKKEPAEEPEPKVKETQAEAEETQVKVTNATEERRDEPADAWAERDEHGDDDAFEEPPAPAPAPAAAPRLVSVSVSESEPALVPLPRSRVLTPQLSVCMVCGLELSAWGILEQQLHVNACLDKGTNTQAVTVTSRPSSASGGGRPRGGGRGGEATTTVATTGTKRKRGRQQTTLHPQDEQLSVALALSKSLVGKEQQVDMDMALVTGELAQVDAQLAKLQKKRVALIKKLERLEKAKRKVHKGDVRSPEETKALLDLSWALRVLFPEPRQVGMLEDEDRNDTTRRKSRLVELFQGSEATTVRSSGGAYVAMWLRASQSQSVGSKTETENEDALYTNQLMRELLARAEQTKARSDAPIDGVSAKPEPLENEMETDALQVDCETMALEVPDVVKRVFPQWAENLAFLKTQSVEDLKSALAELQQMRMERTMDKAMSSDETGGGGGGEGQGGGDAEAAEEDSDKANPDQEDDEELACAYFEREMMRLITEKQCEAPSPHKDGNHDSLGGKDVEIVELMDSSDDDGVENDGSERDEHGSDDDHDFSTAATTASATTTATTPAAAATDSASDLSADGDGLRPPSDDEKSVSSDDNHSAVEEPEPVVALTSSSELERLESPQQDRLVAHNEIIPTTANCAEEELLETTNELVAPLEQQLLDALKANASLYEAVLLLQPLDLQQLLHYIRHEAKIKCAKTVLVRFCDRHGITFKQS